jgi:hypothetical protein
MAFDDYNFRPITFQGVTFPATLMGISVFVSIFDTDEDLGDWIWRLSNCRGVPKRAAADRCARCARQAADLLLEQRQRVLDYIKENMGPHDFEPEETYRDWLLSLQKIAELSSATEGECVWSAPFHPRDPYKTPDEVARAAKRVLEWLDDIQGKPPKFSDTEEPPPPQIP